MAWYKKVRSNSVSGFDSRLELRATHRRLATLGVLVWSWSINASAESVSTSVKPNSVAMSASAASTDSAAQAHEAEPVDEAAQVDDEAQANKLQARVHFQRGVALFNQGENQGALSEFRAANEIMSHPSVWYNIGLVLTAMNRPLDALGAFEKVIDEPTSDAGLVDNAREKHEQLLGTVGTVQLDAAVAGALVRVDDVEFGHTPLSRPLRLVAGRHVVELLDAGYQVWRRELEVPAGGQIVVEVVMEPRGAPLAISTPTGSTPTPLVVAPLPAADEPRSRYRRVATYGALALGGAGLGLAAVAVGVGRGLCPDAGCPPLRDDPNADAYDAWRMTAIVSAIGGVVFGAAGVALLLTADDEPSSPAVAIIAGPRQFGAQVTF